MGQSAISPIALDLSICLSVYMYVCVSVCVFVCYTRSHRSYLSENQNNK